ncbi:MAG TPA: hypothetical protein PK397_04740 [Ignavibacteriaceae bacterium]|jgi:hypothetical protein|nr:hypothetical protein [Ignavibacteriaceae bacterium]
MKFIRFYTLLIFTWICFILPGCLNYEQEVSFYPDGSGTMRISYWMSLPDTLKLEVLNQVGLFNRDSITNQFSSSYSNVENVTVYTDTTDSTIHASIQLSFTHIDSLNNTRPFSEANFSLKDGAAGQKIFSQFIPPVATGFGFDGSDFQVKYIYDFPGEIITHNAHSAGKRKLEWNYSLAELGRGKTISVTYRPFKLKETPLWIYIVSGAVLVVVIIFLLRKKKSW